MKRSLFFLIALVTLSSCGNVEAVDLTVWAWNRNVDILTEAIERYKNEVDESFSATVTSFSSNDVNTKVNSAIEQLDGSQVSDILLGDSIYMRSYFSKWDDLFVNFENYGVDSDLQSKFLTSSIELVTYDDKLLALPYGIGPTVVFAYRPLWEESILNGIIENGWTWDDYIEYGIQISEENPGTYMTAYNLKTDDRIYRTMVSQYGEMFLDKDLTVQVGNSTSILAMNKIKEMFDKNVLGHIDSGDFRTQMIEGNIAAQIHGFFVGGQLKSAGPDTSGDWAILPLPSWLPNETSASITGGSYLYVNNTISNSKKSKATDFVKWYALNVENSLKGLEIGGIYSPLVEAYSSDTYLNTEDPFFMNQKTLLDTANFSKDALPIYPSQYFTYNLNQFVLAQESILFNGESISDALSQARTNIVNNIEAN
jgi:multiple sugar transport system substrate-binding protein